jgi:peptide/nickel transport system ATP-binding protein
LEQTSKNILEVNNLVTEFATEDGALKAVDNISFSLKPGETLGIVGESGSGKSVTSLSIMRLIQTPPGKISAGEILFNTQAGSVNLLALPEKKMRKIRGNEIAMIFQEPMTSLNPVYTCGAQVMEAILEHRNFHEVSRKKSLYEYILKNFIAVIPGILFLFPFFTSLLFALTLPTMAIVSMYAVALTMLFVSPSRFFLTTKERIAKAITIDLFEQTELPDPERMFRSYPHQLSGGQKQRVMIAMAMSCDPKILIADEPTTALDVTIQKTILELMKNLQKKHNMAIIFITHDLGVVAELADKVMVMYKGKIVEEGTVREIFKNPKHPYTKGLLACRPRLDVRLHKLPVVSDFMNTDAQDNITESGYNINELIEKYKVTSAERDAQLNKIYSKEPILQIRNLSKWFPKGKNMFGKTVSHTKAVDDVSFDVYEGETVGLVGESGCGKTTLGRALIRLIEPTSGQVLYNGQNLNKTSSSQMRDMRKDLQIIFQDPYSSLNPRMSIGEAIMEPMRVHNIFKNDTVRKNRVIEILERVNMKPAHFGRYPHEFSGGQRQRICIARSIALQPKFIICDESVSALDVSVQAQVLNLLNELKRDFNFTYIFISHDLSVVKFMSDRMLVMSAGKIVEMDIAEKIYSNPEKEYTKKLIEAIPKGL